MYSGMQIKITAIIAFGRWARLARQVLAAGTFMFSGFALGVEGVAPELQLESRPFVFADGGNAASYRMTLGNLSTPDVIIFFISGSGCATVKHRLPAYFNPIRVSIDATVFMLQKRGIDEENKSGHFCTSAFRAADHFDQTVKDQQEFINATLAGRGVAPRAVVIVGASEGAVVAARIATEDKRITHLGLVGGGGGPVRENLRILSASTWYLHRPESGFADIAADPDNTEKEIWGQTYRYWSELLDIDIGKLLLSLDTPIVMAMGDTDRSVPLAPTRELQAKFVERGKRNFKLMIFPNANHRLEDVDNGKSYAPDFLQALVANVNEAVIPHEAREQAQSASREHAAESR